MGIVHYRYTKKKKRSLSSHTESIGVHKSMQAHRDQLACTETCNCVRVLIKIIYAFPNFPKAQFLPTYIHNRRPPCTQTLKKVHLNPCEPALKQII